MLDLSTKDRDGRLGSNGGGVIVGGANVLEMKKKLITGGGVV